MVPPKLPVPANVYITGTVNIDETTHMFSPKVLDRANVLEFNEVDLLDNAKHAPPSKFVLDKGDIGSSAPPAPPAPGAATTANEGSSGEVNVNKIKIGSAVCR